VLVDGVRSLILRMVVDDTDGYVQFDRHRSVEWVWVISLSLVMERR